MTVALAATAWVLCFGFRKRYPRRTLQAFGIKAAGALILAVGLVSIVFVPMRKALRENSFERSQDLVGQLSAKPADLWITPYDSLLFPGTRLRFGFSPGWIKVTLASLGVLLGLWHRKRRRWVLFLLLTTIITAVLAIGSNLKLGDVELWWILAKYVPGISQVRNVFRFVYLTQMAIILLSMIALTEVWLRLRARAWRRVTSTVLVTVVAMVAFIEVPTPQATAGWRAGFKSPCRMGNVFETQHATRKGHSLPAVSFWYGGHGFRFNRPLDVSGGVARSSDDQRIFRILSTQLSEVPGSNQQGWPVRRHSHAACGHEDPFHRDSQHVQISDSVSADWKWRSRTCWTQIAARI